MPTIKQTFEHELSSFSTTSSTIYNYLKKGVAYTLCKEMSQVFYEDFKTLLEQTGIESLSFSENNYYATGTDCPYFEIFGLQFPFGVMQLSSTCYRPIVYRTGEYENNNCLMYGKNNTTASSTMGLNTSSSITKESSNLKVYYELTINYNDNILIASCSNIYGIKMPICCLIKGIDINNKNVVYISGNCNGTCSTNDGNLSPIYHKLVWSEDWYMNPYSSQTATPAHNTTNPAHANYNSAMFLKTFANDLVGKICTLDNKILMMQPICCGGRITFDNLYVVPDTVNINTYYTINGETYYCPGDTIVQNHIQYNANTMTTYGLRFLIKI